MKTFSIFNYSKNIAHRVLLILAAIVVANVTMAQQKVFAVNNNNPLKNFSTASKSESHPFFVDIDGDNKLDCFIGEYTNGKLSKIYYYHNEGSNSFPIYKNVTGNGNPLNAVISNTLSIPYFIDIDNDGDYDCFISDGSTGEVAFYQNTGSRTQPQFEKQSAAFNPLSMIKFSASRIADIAFADVDGDGDYDCLVTNEEGNENYYKNTGTSTAPVFAHVAGSDNPFAFLDGDHSIYNVSFYDWNNDGLVDLFVNTTYYKNTGTKDRPQFAKSKYDAPVFQSSSAQKYAFTPIRWVNLNGNTAVFQGTSNGAVVYQTVSTSNNNASAASVALPVLRIYPNPSKEEFILNITRNETTESIVRVTDVQGKLLTTQVINEGSYRFGKDFNSGTYFVQVMQNNNVVYSQKVIKQ